MGEIIRLNVRPKPREVEPLSEHPAKVLAIAYGNWFSNFCDDLRKGKVEEIIKP